MPNLKIETHGRADDEDIFNLQQCVYPDHHLYSDRELTRQYWQWRYFSHPSIKSEIYVTKPVMGDGVAGMRPVTFIPIQIDGEPFPAVWLTAVITHPQYRRMGIFSNLVRHSMSVARQRKARFAFTFPNEKSFGIYKNKTEWRYVSAIPLYVKILNPIRCLTAGINRLPLFRKPGRLNLPQRPKRNVLVGGTRDELRCYRVDTTMRLGVDYDRLWERAAGGFKIVVKRDAAYLYWRYVQNPTAQYTIFEARRRSDRQLIGYLVTTIQVRDSISIGLIVDMLVDRAFSDALRTLIHMANDHFRSSGAIVAACLMNNHHAYARSLFRCGYVPIPIRITPKKFHFICTNLTDDNGFGDYIADFDNWYLTWGDTDNV